MLPCGHGGTTHLLQAGGIQLSFVYNLHRHLGETETRGEGVMREKNGRSQKRLVLCIFAAGVR